MKEAVENLLRYRMVEQDLKRAPYILYIATTSLWHTYELVMVVKGLFWRRFALKETCKLISYFYNQLFEKELFYKGDASIAHSFWFIVLGRTPITKK